MDSSSQVIAVVGRPLGQQAAGSPCGESRLSQTAGVPRPALQSPERITTTGGAWKAGLLGTLEQDRGSFLCTQHSPHRG